MNNDKRPLLALIFSMAIFGTIGLFRRYIPLPSGALAMMRGLIGTLFLLAFALLRGKRLSLRAIKKNFLLLTVSGALIGFNWILLFEAYRYTTVATATLCYYMAPVFVILCAPFVLGERLTTKKTVCAAFSFVGMVAVSGVIDGGFAGISDLTGVLFGLGAAALYASVILLNKKLRDISAYERTAVQLGFAALTVMPYTLLTEQVEAEAFSPQALLLLAAVGILHTGVAYVLYFGSIEKLPAQTVAIFSYIDPIVAILLSATVLGEGFTPPGLLGAALILGATLASELPTRPK